MERFVYPANLTPDEDDGGYVVTFVDVPGATQGGTLAEALAEAADCLDESIAAYLDDGEPIPEPSRARRGQYLIPLPARMAAKAALYLAMREHDLTKTALAARLKCDEKEVRRMLDPRYATKIDRIEAALAVLGKQLVVGVQAA